jgi:hypothetical protein
MRVAFSGWFDMALSESVVPFAPLIEQLSGEVPPLLFVTTTEAVMR